MKVAFLYCTSHPQDALVNWVLTLGRHTRKYEVELLLRGRQDGFRGLYDMEGDWPEYVFVLTASCYPPHDIDNDLGLLLRSTVKVGVVHNEDWGISTPGDYPSFAWTERSRRNLVGYSAICCPQPVFPRIQEPRPWPMLHAATFGHCDPKKGIAALARRLNQLHIPFTVFCPWTLHDRYHDYIDAVGRAGATVIVHPWRDKVEELGDYFDRAEVSHFLFFLSPSKGGTGGSPTGPRYATMFARPVVVVDDEPESIGPRELNVVAYPDQLERCHFENAFLASCKWTPDRYLDFLTWHTDLYYRERG